MLSSHGGNFFSIELLSENTRALLNSFHLKVARLFLAAMKRKFLMILKQEDCFMRGFKVGLNTSDLTRVDAIEAITTVAIQSRAIKQLF